MTQNPINLVSEARLDDRTSRTDDEHIVEMVLQPPPEHLISTYALLGWVSFLALNGINTPWTVRYSDLIAPVLSLRRDGIQTLDRLVRSLRSGALQTA